MIDYSVLEVEGIVKEHYGITVSATALNGYDELNFVLTDAQSKRYILKVSEWGHGIHFLDAQVRIVNHLAASPVSHYFQKYILNHDGEEITHVRKDGNEYYFRLLTFLEGEFYVTYPEKSEALAEDLGQLVARTDLALSDFSHPAMHRHYTWDISTALDAVRKVPYIRNHERRRIAGYFLLQFETEVLPVLTDLRHAYIHNDANDHNVLVREGRISGMIDFGDMVYSALINNVAVACTYVMLDQADPLPAAVGVVRGYHANLPLQERELKLLYWLISARLCISVTQSAHNASEDSDNEHHFITEKPAWGLLYKWIRINPLKAEDAFLKACGFPGAIGEEGHEDLLQRRHAHVGRNLSISYANKLKIERGALQYLYDDLGRTFVDCVNNPSHVGHCHPVVVKRMQRQIATLNTNTRYLNDLIVEYAGRLTDLLPSRLKVCYFVNSGSEANDLAIRMSRHFTGRKEVIVLDYAYHGTSTSTMEISPYKFDSKGGFGQMPWVHKLMNPDTYRGAYRYDDGDAGIRYAADVDRVIESMRKDGKAPAAFICESLLGVGGQMPLPKGYLTAVYGSVHAAGGVCIADEVQVGFGRVGDVFWGFELQGVEPDIVVMGKPIGNGHPLAAVVVTQEIADAFHNGLEYFNTYGGNPVSMETGLAVLDVIRDEEMQSHAREVGNVLMEGLRELMGEYPIIGDVRGHGLFVGAELVKDRNTLDPAIPEIDIIVEKMKERGFLLSTDGPFHNVLKIKPPMPFSKENARELCAQLGEVLREMGSNGFRIVDF
jgi:4-aminobutyrate aminotransferase-like enzyme/Ser/Thr protein kinase RdoA (MazF antagonist)